MNLNPSSTYKIRFNDCDLFGHLNNSRYLDYFINAREDHLKDYYDLDLSDYYKKGLGWVVGSHEIAYLKPARYNENVTIQSTLLAVTPDYLHVETLMISEKPIQLKALMRTKLIPVDIITGKKEQHSADFTQWAKSIENATANKTHDLHERIKVLLMEFKASAAL
jgi:YbgC/YbaW family acyl-CoA thioester hydrolase